MKWYVDDEQMNRLVAHMVAQHEELYAEAGRVKSTVLGLAAKHNKSGAYVGGLVVQPANPVDVEVAATRPWASKIEWGHRQKGVSHGHRATGRAEVRRGEKWVPGLHIMRNAAIAHGGKVG